MKRDRHFICLMLLLLPLFLAAGELRLVVTADLHGSMEKFCRLAVPIRQVAEPRVAIDLGDLVQGGWVADALDGIPMVDLLNALHYDVLVPGNHDFELGRAAFGRLLNRFQGKVLGAEWDWPGVFTPVKWTMIRRGDVSAAFIGLTDPLQNTRMLPGDGVRFLLASSALAGLEKEVLAEAPDVVVLACHRGRYSSAENLFDLLGRTPWIDVVLGAHTHEEVPGARVGRAFYVQPGSHAAAAAEVTILTDEKGRKPPRITARFLRPEPESEPDPEAARIVAAANAEVRQKIPQKRYTLDVPPGEALANAMLNVGDATAALAVFSGKEPELVAELSNFQLFRLFPYRNEVCTVALSRKELRDVVEAIAHRRRKTMQIAVAGFKITLDKRNNLTHFSAPERVVLAASDYVLTTLARDLPFVRERARRTGITEREVVARFLAP